MPQCRTLVSRHLIACHERGHESRHDPARRLLPPFTVEGSASEVDTEGTYAAVAKYTAQVYPVHKPDLGWLHMHKGELASPAGVDCMYSGMLHKSGQVLVLLPCLLWIVHPADELKLVYAPVMHGLQQAGQLSRTAASTGFGPHDTSARSNV